MRQAQQESNLPLGATNDPDAPFNQIGLKLAKQTPMEHLQSVLKDDLQDILVTGLTGEHKIGTLTTTVTTVVKSSLSSVPDVVDQEVTTGHDYTEHAQFTDACTTAIENGNVEELGRLSYEASIEYATECAKYHRESFDQISND